MNKIWSFSFSISPSSENSGLISLKTGLISLLSKGLSSPASQLESIYSLALFMVQFSQPYMTTGNTIALTTGTFVGRVMSLLFNTLSRFVINFLPRSNNLISWLQSSSAVIFGAQEDDICLYFHHLFPFYLPCSNGYLP